RQVLLLGVLEIDLGDVVVERAELVLDEGVDVRALLELVRRREQETFEARVLRRSGLGDVEALRRLRRRLLVVAAEPGVLGDIGDLRARVALGDRDALGLQRRRALRRRRGVV